MESQYSNELRQTQVSKLVELVTGKNNLNYLLVSNKIYGSNELCQIGEEDETFHEYIELVTGQNNLNYLSNKIYGNNELCQIGEEEEETFYEYALASI